MSKKSQSKPQTHRSDAAKPGPTEFVSKRIPGAKPGEWQGRFVPATPAAKKAAAKLAKMNVPADPAQYVNG